jgi:hypothetical protein
MKRDLECLGFQRSPSDDTANSLIGVASAGAGSRVDDGGLHLQGTLLHLQPNNAGIDGASP